MFRKVGFAGLVAALALALAAGTASAQTLRGTVVHANERAHSFVVANSRGALSAVHSRRSLKPGRIVRLTARRLRNGTFALRSARVLGRTRHAHLRGTVTFARKGSFVVSATGASLVVNESAGDSQAPSVGDQVQVNGTIDDQGDIEEQDVQQTGTDTSGIHLEGKVLAVDSGARTLSISADDSEETGASVTVDVPQAFDITMFAAGQEVELGVSANGDGTYTLVSSSEDGNSSQANDQQTQQQDQQDQQDGQSQQDQPDSPQTQQPGDGSGD